MYNNYYGKQKDGKILEFDQFMTIGKTYKWDYEEIENDALRIFNPSSNETIFTQPINEVLEFSENTEIGWDDVTNYINSQCRDIIIYYYKENDRKEK